MSLPEHMQEAPVDPRAEGTDHKVLQHELKRAWRTTLQLGMSLAGTWTVALLVRFLLPRRLGPAQFGDLTFAETFAGGFVLFVNFGLDTYSMREIAVRPKHASDYFGGTQLLRVVGAVALSVVMAIELSLRGKPILLQLAVATWTVYWLTVAFNNTLSTFLQATGKTQRLALANFLGKVLWGLGMGAALGLVPLDSPVWIFILPALIAEIVKSFMIFPAARRAVDLVLRIDVAATKKVLLTSLPYFLSTLASTLGGPLNFWVLDLLTKDKRELGWYGAMLNLASLAMVFSPLLHWVLLPLLSRARARSVAEVDNIMSFALEAFMLAVIPVLLMANLGAELWVTLAFGDAYAPALLTFQIMIATIGVTYAAMILSMGLVAHGYSWSISWLSLTSVTAAPVLSALAVPLLGKSIGPGGNAAGAAIALGISEAIVVSLSLWRLGAGVMRRRMLIALAKALAAAAIVVAVHPMLPNVGYFRLLLDTAFYVVLVLGSRAVDLRELRTFVQFVRGSPNEAPPAIG